MTTAPATARYSPSGRERGRSPPLSRSYTTIRDTTTGDVPSLKVNDKGSLFVSSFHEGFGRMKSEQELVIVLRNVEFLVAGFSYSVHDSLDLDHGGSCEVNSLSGRALRNRKAVPERVNQMKLADCILEVQYKTAWFLAHRLREAMRSGDLAPFGGEGKVVEVDETFIGKKEGIEVRRGFAHKHALLTLVERGGTARTFHVEGTTAAQLVPIIRANIAKETAIMTDEAGQYTHLGDHFASHENVRHGAGEYGRGMVHTNTVEGFYSVFKRGMKGVYQHCSEKHLHRYAAEFDFRYNSRIKLGVNDTARTERALGGIVGKRLLYRDSFAP